MTNIALIGFTAAGCALAKRLAAGLQEDGVSRTAVFAPQRLAADAGVCPVESLDAFAAAHFPMDDALVFVGAAGIAVRAVAPYVKDKFQDPAVVSIDEQGRFAVPLLSGHVGGANALAGRIAAIAGGQPVVSTATDVNGLWAVDVWARSQGLAICERTLAKEVSARLLEGGKVGFACDFPVEGELPQGLVALDEAQRLGLELDLGICVSAREDAQPFERTLHLVAPCAVVGVGCRRGAAADALAAAVDEALAQAGVSDKAVAAVQSVDLKADEECIAQLSQQRGWRTRFLTAQQLESVPGEFPVSEFVLKTVGVGNVSERAACWPEGRLLTGRITGDKTTASVGIHPFAVRFE